MDIENRIARIKEQIENEQYYLEQNRDNPIAVKYHQESINILQDKLKYYKKLKKDQQGG